MNFPFACDDSVDAFAFFAASAQPAPPPTSAAEMPTADLISNVFSVDRALDASLVPKTTTLETSNSSVRLDVIAAMVFPCV